MTGLPEAADLRALFPDASPDQLGRIRRACERMRPATWMSIPENAAPAPIDGPGLRCTLIGTVSLGEDADDPVELELCVGRTAETAGVVVSATIGFWCWCPQDHNMHYVRDVETTATTSEDLTVAVETATDLIAQWRETVPKDADQWRAEEGLPLRPG